MPIPYLTGHVVGRFLSVVADSIDDLDQEPEVVPMSGTVTFTPQVSAVKVVEGAEEPATVNVATISAEIDEQGYLSRNGQRGIRLLASDGPTNPTGFTYQVTFALSLGKGAAGVKYQGFPIHVPANGTVDLTVAAPVPSSSGSSMVQGVGVQDVTVENGEFVFHLTNGAETRAPLPAVSGEAMVSVSTVEPGHYTVNGVSIMGLTETGALPPTATSEVQSIATTTVTSALAPVQEAVTAADASADEARATANTAVTAADTAVQKATAAETAAASAANAASAADQKASSLETQVSTLTVKVSELEAGGGTTVTYLGDGEYEIGGAA